MSKRIDDRIAREICEFVTDELYYTVRRGYSILKSEWSPSTDIADAIEALERLPKEWIYRIQRDDKGFAVTIWRTHWETDLSLVAGKTPCQAICRALLDKRVLAAVKKAKKKEAK